MTTMDDKYKDGSEHEYCEGCGMCIDCGDCVCDDELRALVDAATDSGLRVLARLEKIVDTEDNEFMINKDEV